MKNLVAASEAVGRKLALAELRFRMKPWLEKNGLEWTDVLPALQTVDSIKELEAAARADKRVADLLAESEVIKVIVVPGRMVNFVTK